MGFSLGSARRARGLPWKVEACRIGHALKDRPGSARGKELSDHLARSFHLAEEEGEAWRGPATLQGSDGVRRGRPAAWPRAADPLLPPPGPRAVRLASPARLPRTCTRLRGRGKGRRTGCPLCGVTGSQPSPLDITGRHRTVTRKHGPRERMRRPAQFRTGPARRAREA